MIFFLKSAHSEARPAWKPVRLFVRDSRTNSLGFTFVEILVVGLLLVILGAVSIPVYQGFVERQRKETVGHIAQAAAASAHAHWRRYNEDPSPDDLRPYLPGADRYSIEVDPDAGTIRIQDLEQEEIDTTVSFR